MRTLTPETGAATSRLRRRAVLALPPVAAAIVLALLTWQVTSAGPLTRLDTAVRDGLGAYTDAHPGIWWPAQIAADIGTPWLAAVLLAVVAVVLSLERHTGSPVYRAAFALFLLGSPGFSPDLRSGVSGPRSVQVAIRLVRSMAIISLGPTAGPAGCEACGACVGPLDGTPSLALTGVAAGSEAGSPASDGWNPTSQTWDQV